VTDDEKRAMLEELVAASRPRTREDCPSPNIIAKEYAAIEGISAGLAYTRLMRAAEAGVYKYAQALVDGRKVNVFWWA